MTAIINIDDEWSSYLIDKQDDVSSDEENTNTNDNNDNNNNNYEHNQRIIFNEPVPEPTDIYISTKSKIAYLTQPVDLKIFWNIPVISYATAENGVIKKQIKINSTTPEELDLLQQRLQSELYYEQHIMSHIDNPNGRIKFKDIRKITIGISKKDILSYRSKKKQAFYNCFVMILRIKIDNIFREFHTKVFNTGKLELPGVQSEKMYYTVLNYVVEILQPFHTAQLEYYEHNDTVLINSNFNCGFFINREILFDIIKNKYNIQAIYDPCCSYPGIQCKFYYNNDIDIQTGMQITSENKEKYTNITQVSFMIFRTGSVLIVGMCNENILREIYQFVKHLLKEEFKYICQKIITPSDLVNKNKKKKIRRKLIHIIEEEDIKDTQDNIEDIKNMEYTKDIIDIIEIKNI
jgi:hypothetical protein